MFLIFFLTLFLTNCKDKKIELQKESINLEKVQIDTSKIAVLKYDSRFFVSNNQSKPTNLAADDFIKVEKMLHNFISDYNAEQNSNSSESKRITEDLLINLNRYKRQYFALLNAKGEKEIWINCFCKDNNPNWKTEKVIVKDGGNCYFNLKVNLTTEEYYEVYINGNA
ncbi:hypothetical protein ACFSX9_04635 [Flavobacterium ardleyense]|uniref:Lipoprotein n=1 Tax=Flavobacterium ardleyense TaxID=2038737 RepID=A0ABW5Z7B8_9FLAO